jgi:hypothetical protein
MTAIAILATNFGLIRALMETPGVSIGLIPMANILGLTYLGLRHRPSSRAFLLGFELFGLIVLLIYLPFIQIFEQPVITYYIVPIRRPVEILAGDMNLPSLVLKFPVVVASIALPLLSFAYLGGCLFNRHRAALYRRFPNLDASVPSTPPALP